jgi:transcriptional pleiotropic regulator of transition state genes
VVLFNCRKVNAEVPASVGCYTLKGGRNMKATGIVRKVDELGRIVIPIEIRKILDINVKDSLEIFTEEDAIVLKKYTPSDIFTGSMDDLIDYKGKKVSKKSIEELAKLAGII